MEKGQVINLGEALDIFQDHIPDIRKACIENIIALNIPKEPPEDYVMNVKNIMYHIDYLSAKQKAEPILKVIKRIDSRNIKPSAQSITDEDITRAKEKPIEELYDGQLIGRKRKFGLCPFHNERSPSFYIFPDNRFKCYGCQLGGTSIDFIMQRDGVDFITAVKTLRGTI